MRLDAIKSRTNIIQDLSEPRDVRQVLTIWAHEGVYGDRSRYYKIWSAHGTERLKEGKEVGTIIRRHHVATNPLTVGILPAVAKMSKKDSKKLESMRTQIQLHPARTLRQPS